MSNNTYRIVLWSSVIGAIVLAVAGMVWLAQGGGQPKVYIPGLNEILADDHVFGKADSKVTLLEFADFECPACGAEYPTVKKLEDAYGDKVRFVYRNFPIPGHVNGIPAAYAAGAAGNQGKFFEMAGLLFTNQGTWTAMDSATLATTLDGYAKSMGLNMDKFHADINSDAVKAKVDKDAQSGVKAGVDSTPTFFLNGVLTQSRTYDEFKGELDKALAK
jgi:protein-disulfide isomerase